jgi:hypothetical protein
VSTFRFFSDAGLTVPLTTLRHLSTQSDRLIYFGSPFAGLQLQDSASPGVANVNISVADSAGGAGLAASAVKLAATNGALAGATGGAALSLGHTIFSGAGNAKPVHLRIDTSAGTLGDDYTDLSLEWGPVAETEV